MSTDNQFGPGMPPIFNEEWTEEQKIQRENAIKRNEWSPVYRYSKLMRIFLLLRLNPVVIATSYGILISTIYEKFFELNFTDLKFELGLNIALIIFAHTLRYLSNEHLTRLIGVVSVDAASKSIYRIGLFTIWGNRRNLYVRIGDFLSLKESNPRGISNFSQLCWTFRPESKPLLIAFNGGEIIDKQAAEFLFGARPVPSYFVQLKRKPDVEQSEAKEKEQQKKPGVTSE